MKTMVISFEVECADDEAPAKFIQATGVRLGAQMPDSVGSYSVQHVSVDEVEKTTEWGVVTSESTFLRTRGQDGVRWNPTMGGLRDPEPYTEAEARSDSAYSGFRVVNRCRTVYEVEDHLTPWGSTLDAPKEKTS